MPRSVRLRVTRVTTSLLGDGTEGATPTYYEVLGVTSSATHDELRDAYRGQALAQHPDRHAESDTAVAGAAEQRMRAVNEAWQVLSDPVSRAAYDAELVRAGRDDAPASTLDDWDAPVVDERWPAERPTSAIAQLLPLLILVGLLLAIAIFTAYAKTG